MPKMKTHKGAAKRFKKTGSGKFKRNHANHGHLFTDKPVKRKRHLRKPGLVSHVDTKRVSKMLPYS